MGGVETGVGEVELSWTDEAEDGVVWFVAGAETGVGEVELSWTDEAEDGVEPAQYGDAAVDDGGLPSSGCDTVTITHRHGCVLLTSWQCASFPGAPRTIASEP